MQGEGPGDVSVAKVWGEQFSVLPPTSHARHTYGHILASLQQGIICNSPCLPANLFSARLAAVAPLTLYSPQSSY